MQKSALLRVVFAWLLCWLPAQGFLSSLAPLRYNTRPSFQTLFLSSSGDDGISKTLDLLYKGARLFKELNSTQVDPPRDVLEEEREKQERKHEEQERRKKGAKNVTSINTDATTTNTTNNANTTRVQQEIEQLFQRKLDAFDRRARRTRIVLIKKIAAWAFEVSDIQQQGKIDRAAFYSGTLLVHLHLAKYVGVAACQPPSREQVDELFYLADADNSQYLDEEEFTNAVVVATAPITSRIAVYWSLLATLPLLVGGTIGGVTHLLHRNLQAMPTSYLTKGPSVLEFIVELLLSRLFFSILVPNIFARIDRAARRYAYKRSSRRKTTTSLWWLRMPSSSSQSSDTRKPWMQQMEDAFRAAQKRSWKASSSKQPPPP